MNDLEQELLNIQGYIEKSYQVKTEINSYYGEIEQICFKNNNLEYPFCSLYLDICPNWGFAPGKILIHYSREKKDHTGGFGANVYIGMQSIDELMNNFFKINKKESQTTIFDYEGVKEWK